MGLMGSVADSSRPLVAVTIDHSSGILGRLIRDDTLVRVTSTVATTGATFTVTTAPQTVATQTFQYRWPDGKRLAGDAIVYVRGQVQDVSTNEYGLRFDITVKKNNTTTLVTQSSTESTVGNATTDLVTKVVAVNIPATDFIEGDTIEFIVDAVVATAAASGGDNTGQFKILHDLNTTDNEFIVQLPVK